MGKEVHIFSPAYNPADFDEITNYCDHIVFNSINQWNTYKNTALSKSISCGLRINPEFSTQDTAIYDPCAKFSRLGITLNNLENADITGVDGLHFHTLCEQNSDALKATLEVVDKKFGKFLKNMKWLNFGGGHHITRDDYDIETLVSSILYIKEKYNLQVYIEPGEAVALNAGFLVSTVLDITHNGINNAILDTSPSCHMPDVLEMPYRPYVINSGKADEFPYMYRFGGATCLAGDIIGDYSFKTPLNIGDKLVFTDMAIYSMVKNNTFNGVNLPHIILRHTNGKFEIIKEFDYEDFKRRL
jgi:carboxynorspermidine decarboxylase